MPMIETSKDYWRMEQVIRYLNSHYTEQPSLQALATLTGLSPGHFQRKFSDWVGVSPKSFLQHLTFNDARQRLCRGESVEQAAWGSGLSGASRLHDLCVVLEAASPGEIKRGGAGLRITYGYGYTPFGRCLLGTSPRGIVYLGFIDDDEPDPLDRMQQLWPLACLVRDDRHISRLLERIFQSRRSPKQTLRAYVQGTRFQLRVWRSLLQVRPGMLINYGQLAAGIGKPDAARAVGTAVGANPLAYLIPCHRVIRASGDTGGYRWGVGRKRIMITREIAETSGQRLSG